MSYHRDFWKTNSPAKGYPLAGEFVFQKSR
jgi:hypothetical protein